MIIVKKKEHKVLPVSELKNHPKNPNKHPASQIEAIAKSIERYGQYYPIIVDEDYNILCGHGKKEGLIKLGKKEADVLVMHGLSEKQKLKLLSEDNKIQTLSMVDFSMQEALIREIGEADIIGFNPQYIENIIGNVSVDNMGVDLGINTTDKPKPANAVTAMPKPSENQTEHRDAFSDDCGNARTVRCPHCGKEITL